MFDVYKITKIVSQMPQIRSRSSNPPRSWKKSQGVGDWGREKREIFLLFHTPASAVYAVKKL